jgi:hypothetical protein
MAKRGKHPGTDFTVETRLAPSLRASVVALGDKTRQAASLPERILARDILARNKEHTRR